MSKPNKVYGGIEWTPANIVTVIRILFIPIFVVALLMPWEQCLFGTDPMGLTVRGASVPCAAGSFEQLGPHCDRCP